VATCQRREVLLDALDADDDLVDAIGPAGLLAQPGVDPGDGAADLVERGEALLGAGRGLGHLGARGRHLGPHRSQQRAHRLHAVQQGRDGVARGGEAVEDGVEGRLGAGTGSQVGQGPVDGVEPPDQTLGERLGSVLLGLGAGPCGLGELRRHLVDAVADVLAPGGGGADLGPQRLELGLERLDGAGGAALDHGGALHGAAQAVDGGRHGGESLELVVEPAHRCWHLGDRRQGLGDRPHLGPQLLEGHAQGG
jgi:hypothetical protein